MMRSFWLGSISAKISVRATRPNSASFVSLELWGLPVVPSQSMAPGEFLVGQFAGNCFIFDRLDTEVLLSTEDGDNFVKNMATVRIESRLAFVVTRPEALITGDLAAST